MLRKKLTHRNHAATPTHRFTLHQSIHHSQTTHHKIKYQATEPVFPAPLARKITPPMIIECHTYIKFRHSQKITTRNTIGTYKICVQILKNRTGQTGNERVYFISMYYVHSITAWTHFSIMNIRKTTHKRFAVIHRPTFNLTWTKRHKIIYKIYK